MTDPRTSIPLIQHSIMVPIRRKLTEMEMTSVNSAFNVLFNVIYVRRSPTRIESRANLVEVTDEQPEPSYITIAFCNGFRRDDLPQAALWMNDGTPTACVIDSAIKMEPLPEGAWHPG